MKTREKTNPQINDLISFLKKASRENGVNLWQDIAYNLERPRKNYAEVNISKINRYAAAGETIIVPGKVLGTGIIENAVYVAALDFSSSANDKILSANGECMTIKDLVLKNPKGSHIRILR